jgi:branched-chain amino acid transport system ATP-binding protein
MSDSSRLKNLNHVGITTPISAAPSHTTPRADDVLLHTTALTKRFGGLAAVSSISIALTRGQIHAVIGPNGAGKSTLTHLISGDLKPSAGTVHLGASNVTGWPAARIARQGLGRSFQKTNVFLPFSVWDNVRLAAQACEPQPAWHAGRWLHSVASPKRFAATHARAQAAIELAQLQTHTHTVAGNLSHGGQRQLEIAMALATQPQVLLLDEPLAGMGVAEAERMIELLHRLKAKHAMLLVEHDMDAVFALADVLTVMVNGEQIASGKPVDIRSNARVQAAYLGEEAQHD